MYVFIFYSKMYLFLSKKKTPNFYLFILKCIIYLFTINIRIYLFIYHRPQGGPNGKRTAWTAHRTTGERTRRKILSDWPSRWHKITLDFRLVFGFCLSLVTCTRLRGSWMRTRSHGAVMNSPSITSTPDSLKVGPVTDANRFLGRCSEKRVSWRNLR